MASINFHTHSLNVFLVVWNSIAICGSVLYVFKKAKGHSRCTGVPPSGRSPSCHIFLQRDATIARVTPKNSETASETRTYFGGKLFLRTAWYEEPQGLPWSHCGCFPFHGVWGGVGCGVWWGLICSPAPNVEFTTSKDCGQQIWQPICSAGSFPTKTTWVAADTMYTNRLVVILPHTINFCID